MDTQILTKGNKKRRKLTCGAFCFVNEYLVDNKIINFQRNYWEKLPKSATRKVTEKTILYSKVRPVQMHNGIFTDLDFDNIVVSNAFFTIDVDESIADPHFIYYYLTDRKQISKMQILAESSTTYPTLSLENVENFEIELPNINAQTHIGNLLSNIDKKINLNNKINDNLEKQIMKIYDEWFIKFNFPSNQNFYNKTKNKISTTSSLPSTWEIQQLNNNVLCFIIPSGIEKFEGEKIYYQTKSLQNKSIKDGERITYKNRKRRANMQPIKNSVWFAKMKDTKKHLFISENMDFIINDSILSTGFCGLLCNKNSFEYISSIVMNSNFEEKKNFLSHGATQQAINIDDLSNMEITIPDKETLNKYHSLTKPLFLKITENIIENRKLSSLKEILLPLLMNGQVTIED
ncbi:restriction endonuclease subunit S [Mycoplasmopsis bovis]